jgi:hypothetical protein
MTDKAFPWRFVSAAIKPHRSAIAVSIGTILPANRACSYSQNQVLDVSDERRIEEVDFHLVPVYYLNTYR